MRDGWERVQLGTVLKLALDKVTVHDSEHYPLAGVLSFGRGLFGRDDLAGANTSYRHLHRLHSGDFVMSKLKAWEGAVAVIGPEFDGAVLSPEFPTYEVDASRLLPSYLGLMATYPAFWSYLATKSSGMGGRKERVHQDRVLELEVDLPPLGEQRRIVDLTAAVDDNITAAEHARERTRKLVASASDELIPWRTPSTPLGEVAVIDAKLVDPTLPEYCDLPHLGIERIVAREGYLLELASASADGVTSGKFLFDSSHVVYSKIRPELRKAVLPGFAGLCSADAYPLRAVPPVSPQYLLELVLSEGFATRAIAKSGRTKMPKINRAELFSIEVEVPSLEVQERAVALLGGLRDLCSALDRTLTELRAARLTLLADLLSGEHEIPESYDALLDGAA